MGDIGDYRGNFDEIIINYFQRIPHVVSVSLFGRKIFSRFQYQ